MSNADIEVVQQVVEQEVNFESETQIVVVQERIVQVVEVVSGFVPSDEYVEKAGDTMTGDLEVNTQITENGSPVVSISSATRTIYVTKTGDDATGDGRTVGTAFLTRQKALDVAAIQRSVDETVIQYGAGTWDGGAVIGTVAFGTIREKGNNTLDPTETTFEGGLDSFQFTWGIRNENTGVYYIAEGIEFSNHFYAMQAENTRVDIVGCTFTQCSYAYRDLVGSALRLIQGDVATTYAGWTAGTNFAFSGGKGGSITMSDDVVATNMDRFVSIQDNGSFTLSSGFTPNIAFKTNASQGPFVIFAQEKTNISLQGGFIADGNDTTPNAASAFIYASSGSPCNVFILGGTTNVLTDFAYRINSSEAGTVLMNDSDSVTWTETNVGSPYNVNIGSTSTDITSTIALPGGTFKPQVYDTSLLMQDLNETAKTAEYDILSTDQNVICDTSGGAFPVNLEANPPTRRVVTVILDTDGNPLTIDGNGKNIDGSASKKIYTSGAMTLIYNGTQWDIISGKGLVNAIEIASATVENTVTETEIYSATLEAGHLTPYHIMELHTDGIISNATAADDVTIRVKAGGTTLLTFNAGIGNISNEPWSTDLHFTVRSVGVTGQIAIHAHTDVNGFNAEASSLNTIDTTITNDLTVTVEWDKAKAGNIMERYQGYIKHLN